MKVVADNVTLDLYRAESAPVRAFSRSCFFRSCAQRGNFLCRKNDSSSTVRFNADVCAGNHAPSRIDIQKSSSARFEITSNSSSASNYFQFA
jgi:hypothetical protein